MSQEKYWEQEYKEPQFLSLNNEPQEEVKRFIDWLKQEQEYDVHGKVVLDVGCGNGRNSIYLAEKYACAGFAWDISSTALLLAEDASEEKGVRGQIKFQKKNIGESPYDLEDQSIDIILDVTTSSSLYEGEHSVYRKETHRVLKSDGYMLVRALLKDGDRNAHNLLEKFPGPEKDTYIHPKTLIIERVFTEKDFRQLFEEQFEILELKKQTGYQRWGKSSYKRRYIVAYLKTK